MTSFKAPALRHCLGEGAYIHASRVGSNGLSLSSGNLIAVSLSSGGVVEVSLSLGRRQTSLQLGRRGVDCYKEWSSSPHVCHESSESDDLQYKSQRWNTAIWSLHPGWWGCLSLSDKETANKFVSISLICAASLRKTTTYKF